MNCSKLFRFLFFFLYLGAQVPVAAESETEIGGAGVTELSHWQSLTACVPNEGTEAHEAGIDADHGLFIGSEGAVAVA